MERRQRREGREKKEGVFQLEGTYKDHQLPDQFKSEQKLKHVVMAIV